MTFRIRATASLILFSLTDPSLTDIKDVANLAKSYVHSQKMIGKDRITLPGKEATDEEWGTFYSELGRPEEAKSYDFGERPSLPEGLEYDEDFDYEEYKKLIENENIDLTP